MVILKPQKTAILTILAGLGFEFLDNLGHFQVWNSQTSKLKALKIVKIAVFDPLTSDNVNFT